MVFELIKNNLGDQGDSELLYHAVKKFMNWLTEEYKQMDLINEIMCKKSGLLLLTSDERYNLILYVFFSSSHHYFLLCSQLTLFEQRFFKLQVRLF